MKDRAEASGQIHYCKEGFTLHWNPRGLEIEVTDYHAGVLTLPWDQVLALVRSSGYRRPGRKTVAPRADA